MNFLNQSLIEVELERLNKDISFQKAVSNIKEGKFKRDSTNADYNDRLIFTKELRNFLYNPAALNIIFSDQELKTSFFRTFGYKGNTNFTIYPKCWLRDLPLVDIGEGAYLGDNILLGTNVVTDNQEEIIVGKITIGERCIFNQGCSVGGGSNIGRDSKVGFETSIDFKNIIGRKARIGSRVGIGNGTLIGNDVKIADFVQIGNFCVIEDGASIDEMTKIPSYSLVTKHGIFPRRRRAAA